VREPITHPGGGPEEEARGGCNGKEAAHAQFSYLSNGKDGEAGRGNWIERMVRRRETKRERGRGTASAHAHLFSLSSLPHSSPSSHIRKTCPPFDLFSQRFRVCSTRVCAGVRAYAVRVLELQVRARNSARMCAHTHLHAHVGGMEGAMVDGVGGAEGREG
jgi:hypothetical protein